MLFSPMTSATPRRTRPVNVGALAIRACERASLAQKEVYLPMGYTAPQWSNAVAGKPGYGLDLWRIPNAPLRWIVEFIPLFMAAVMRVWILDIRGDLLTAGLCEKEDQGKDGDAR